jgi:methionyl-tRNA formyltransferase
LNVIFLGTPNFAVSTLSALIACEDIKVSAVVTQPDRQSGRGQKLHAPPIKVLAETHNIPVLQPVKLSKSPDIIDHIRKLAPDLLIMVAFGQILKSELLAIPRIGVVNLHASLLPAYRGAAPINWAIINGETVTGITTMFTEAGLDTGPILLKEEIEIPEDINAADLSQQMANRGAVLTIKTIEQLKTGQLKPIPQDDSKATYAPLLSKETAIINWDKPASSIHNLVRGLIPWPVAFTNFQNQPLKIWQTRVPSQSEVKDLVATYSSEPGKIVVVNKHLMVACNQGTWLEVMEVQPANKSKLNACDWANGIRLHNGDKFQLER